jgi:DNA-binding transcriptional ArsR family regulator
MSDGLSKRELEVLSRLQHGLSNKEIGLALSISPRTVQKHLQRVYQHLGVQAVLKPSSERIGKRGLSEHDASEAIDLLRLEARSGVNM